MMVNHYNFVMLFYAYKIRVMLNCAPGTLVKHTLKKINVVTFYTRMILNV
jgi:hypothetical protein